MLKSLETVLGETKKAVGSFNILDLDMARGVLDAAVEERRPVIIGIATRHWKAIHAPQLVPSLLAMIGDAPVSVALHLDHARPDQIDLIREALDLGFTGIMIDGSALPYGENLAVTAEVVSLSHRYNAGVEGELGALAGQEGVADTGHDAPQAMPYTNPVEAARFAEESGVDALAIAVGTAHGLYKDIPAISFETIAATAGITTVPLVMHGATGVSDEAVRRSVDSGIRKINFFSGLLVAAMDRVREHSGEKGNDYQAFKEKLIASYRVVARTQIRLYTGE